MDLFANATGVNLIFKFCASDVLNWCFSLFYSCFLFEQNHKMYRKEKFNCGVICHHRSGLSWCRGVLFCHIQKFDDNINGSMDMCTPNLL